MGAQLVPGAAVTQYAVLDALLAGAYESGIPLGEVRALGDFGLGCCDHLGGEVVVVDGEAFECTPDGRVSPMADDEVLPFAEICPRGVIPSQPIAGLDQSALSAWIESVLLSRNLFHAVRVDGRFDSVRVRVTPRQEAALRPLAEVARDQIETTLLGASGSLVGFWVPTIYQGVSVAGLHLHFISDDRRAGGHVLDVAVRSAEASVAGYARLDLRLPTDERFLRTELTHDDDHRIVAVEGGGAAG